MMVYLEEFRVQVVYFASVGTMTQSSGIRPHTQQ